MYDFCLIIIIITYDHSLIFFLGFLATEDTKVTLKTTKWWFLFYLHFTSGCLKYFSLSIELVLPLILENFDDIDTVKRLRNCNNLFNLLFSDCLVIICLEIKKIFSTEYVSNHLAWAVWDDEQTSERALHIRCEVITSAFTNFKLVFKPYNKQLVNLERSVITGQTSALPYSSRYRSVNTARVSSRFYRYDLISG